MGENALVKDTINGCNYGSNWNNLSYTRSHCLTKCLNAFLGYLTLCCPLVVLKVTYSWDTLLQRFGGQNQYNGVSPKSLKSYQEVAMEMKPRMGIAHTKPSQHYIFFT